jgi:hypothetical protein
MLDVHVNTLWVAYSYRYIFKIQTMRLDLCFEGYGLLCTLSTDESCRTAQRLKQAEEYIYLDSDMYCISSELIPS